MGPDGWRRCVLRMDHHCYLLNNCIGLGNYAHFLRFCLFLFLGSAYGVCPTCGCVYGWWWLRSHAHGSCCRTEFICVQHCIRAVLRHMLLHAAQAAGQAVQQLTLKAPSLRQLCLLRRRHRQCMCWQPGTTCMLWALQMEYQLQQPSLPCRQRCCCSTSDRSLGMMQTGSLTGVNSLWPLCCASVPALAWLLCRPGIYTC